MIVLEREVEERASYCQETNRIPDPYYFLFDAEGDLFSPSHNCKVTSIIKTDHLVGNLEKKACEIISSWARQEHGGAIAWVSPPYPGLYPVSKVIISEIEYVNGAKRLFNRAIVLDIDQVQCLKLGQALVRFSPNQPFLVSAEDLRATPIVLDTNRYSWLDILERVMVDARQVEAIKTGTDIIAKETALLTGGVAGDKPASCPPFVSGNVVFGTAFQIFSQSSLIVENDKYGPLKFECPKCKKTNRRPYGQLIPNCQHCGSSEVGC